MKSTTFLLAALLGLTAGTALATDDSAVRAQVFQTIQGMIAAEERFDAAAVWAVHADVPGYRWVDTDGTAYDFAGTKKVWTDYLAGCAKLKYTTLKEDVLVLAPDLAFYTWTGSTDVTSKDGPRTRHEQWTARYLCRRIDGAWRIIGGQESSAPGKVVGAATAEEARAAFEAYLEFWNKHDANALARAFSPDLIYHYNGTIIPAAPQDHLAALKEFGDALPDLVGRIDHFAFTDGIGAASTTWIGTHQGTLSGIPATGGQPVPPTGRKVTIATNYLFRVESGRIVELWETWNEGGIYQQLLQPEPTTANP